MSWNPDTVGSAGVSSRRADPLTYRNPAGKLSTSSAPWTGPVSTLVTVIVYGTSWPRVTSTSGAVLATVNAPGGRSTGIETPPEALCGGSFQVKAPVLVAAVQIATVPLRVARNS